MEGLVHYKLYWRGSSAITRHSVFDIHILQGGHINHRQGQHCLHCDCCNLYRNHGLCDTKHGFDSMLVHQTHHWKGLYLDLVEGGR